MSASREALDSWTAAVDRLLGEPEPDAAAALIYTMNVPGVGKWVVRRSADPRMVVLTFESDETATTIAFPATALDDLLGALRRSRSAL